MGQNSREGNGSVCSNGRKRGGNTVVQVVEIFDLKGDFSKPRGGSSDSRGVLRGKSGGESSATAYGGAAGNVGLEIHKRGGSDGVASHSGSSGATRATRGKADREGDSCHQFQGGDKGRRPQDNPGTECQRVRSKVEAEGGGSHRRGYV